MPSGAAAVLIAVTCAQVPGGDGDFVMVSCRSPNARPLEITLPAYGGPFSLHVLRGNSSAPWLVQIEPGGSDIHFWWIPLSVETNGLKTLLSKPIETSTQDAVCAGIEPGAQVQVIRHLWEGHPGESHYAPHRYEVQTYTLDRARSRYVEGPAKQTRGRHKSWELAAKALGITCGSLSAELPSE